MMTLFRHVQGIFEPEKQGWNNQSFDFGIMIIDEGRYEADLASNESDIEWVLFPGTIDTSFIHGHLWLKKISPQR